MNCVPRISNATEAAAKERFRVIDREDVRFTSDPDEVDIAENVFPVKHDLRKVLAEPAAAAYYIQYYIRPFAEPRTLTEAMAPIMHPPAEVVAATDIF